MWVRILGFLFFFFFFLFSNQTQKCRALYMHPHQWVVLWRHFQKSEWISNYFKCGFSLLWVIFERIIFWYENETNYTIHTQKYMWHVPFVKHKSKQSPFSDRLSDLYTLCMHKTALYAMKVSINVNYYSFTSFCFQANFARICMHPLITLPENLVVIC